MATWAPRRAGTEAGVADDRVNRTGTEGTMTDTTNDDVTENKPSEDGSAGAISPDEVLAGGSRDEAAEERRRNR